MSNFAANLTLLYPGEIDPNRNPMGVVDARILAYLAEGLIDSAGASEEEAALLVRDSQAELSTHAPGSRSVVIHNTIGDVFPRPTAAEIGRPLGRTVEQLLDEHRQMLTRLGGSVVGSVASIDSFTAARDSYFVPIDHPNTLTTVLGLANEAFLGRERHDVKTIRPGEGFDAHSGAADTNHANRIVYVPNPGWLSLTVRSIY